MEEYWDFLCSTLEILQDKEKKDAIREYGRRKEQQARARVIAGVEDEIMAAMDTTYERDEEKTFDALAELLVKLRKLPE